MPQKTRFRNLYSFFPNIQELHVLSVMLRIVGRSRTEMVNRAHCFRALDKFHTLGKGATRSRSDGRMLIAFQVLTNSCYREVTTVLKCVLKPRDYLFSCRLRFTPSKLVFFPAVKFATY